MVPTVFGRSCIEGHPLRLFVACCCCYSWWELGWVNGEFVVGWLDYGVSCLRFMDLEFLSFVIAGSPQHTTGSGGEPRPKRFVCFAEVSNRDGTDPACRN